MSATPGLQVQGHWAVILDYTDNKKLFMVKIMD